MLLVFAIPYGLGAGSVDAALNNYVALESTAGIWASSFLCFHHGMSEEIAAACASLFYLGITARRAFNGFLANRVSVGLYPVYMGIILLVMIVMHEKLLRVKV